MKTITGCFSHNGVLAFVGAAAAMTVGLLIGGFVTRDTRDYEAELHGAMCREANEKVEAFRVCTSSRSTGLCLVTPADIREAARALRFAKEECDVP